MGVESIMESYIMDIKKKKVQYASNKELLSMLLEDTYSKYNKAISLYNSGNWRDKIKGNEICKKIINNLYYLDEIIDYKNDSVKVQEGLKDISKIYKFLIDNLNNCIVNNNDAEKLIKNRDTFKIIMDMYV